MKLSELTSGKDNNLNLLRAIAATAVLYSHSFTLSTGDPTTEPWRTFIGLTPGSVAVSVFFLISGFLVTASITKAKSIGQFATARALRIFPGLVGMLLFTTFIVAPAISKSHPAEFFGKETFLYFLKCSTLVSGVAYKLPGVFESNPYKNVVNGSLWTMPWEVRSYIGLVIAWLIAASMQKKFKAAFLFLTAVVGTCIYGLFQNALRLNSAWAETLLPVTFFIFGSMQWQLKEKIDLTNIGYCVVMLVAIASMCLSKTVFYITLPFCLSYLALHAAYVPKGFIRKYNALGDYSYGIYLYAFPAQQLIAMYWKGVAPLHMFASSLATTLLCAIASWHLIEQPALKMKP